MKASNTAFTLTELIVLITILAIFGTISFISIGGYTESARNSIRLDAIGKISIALENKIVKGQKILAFAESGREVANISISGRSALIGNEYQAGSLNTEALEINSSHFQDPTSKDFYLVGASTSRKGKYQVAATLKEDSGQQIAKVIGNYTPRNSENIAINSNIGSNDIILQDSSSIGVLAVGDSISGINIPYGTKISEISADGMTLTLSGNGVTGMCSHIYLRTPESSGLIASYNNNTSPVINGSKTSLGYFIGIDIGGAMNVASSLPFLNFGDYCAGDYHTSLNNSGGFYSSPTVQNYWAFAALKSDGSISAWGNASYGGSGVPSGTGFTDIYSTSGAFAALKFDGSISVWGNASQGGSGAPVGTGFIKIFSNNEAFVALHSDGSISAWGNASYGGVGAPAGTDFNSIYSNSGAFAALKSDGSISVWGNASQGGSGAPVGTGFTKISASNGAFAALKSDGSISVWGAAGEGGVGAPAGTGFIKIIGTYGAFAALKSDGSISAWGAAGEGGVGAPAGTGFTKIFASDGAFAALKSDGSISAWGGASYGGSGSPAGGGYIDIFPSLSAFAALKSDGSISAWGDAGQGGSGAPAGTGFVKIFSNAAAFAALKSDGSISAWGAAVQGGSGAPIGTGFMDIFSNGVAFTALKSDGSISAWGATGQGGSDSPTGTGFIVTNGETPLCD